MHVNINKYQFGNKLFKKMHVFYCNKSRSKQCTNALYKSMIFKRLDSRHGGTYTSSWDL